MKETIIQGGAVLLLLAAIAFGFWLKFAWRGIVYRASERVFRKKIDRSGKMP